MRRKKGFFCACYQWWWVLYFRHLSDLSLFSPSLPCSTPSLHASPLLTTQTPTAPPPPRMVDFYHLSLSLHVFHRPLSPLGLLPELLSPSPPCCVFFLYFLPSVPNLPLFCPARISSVVESFSFEVLLDFFMAVILISHLLVVRPDSEYYRPGVCGKSS